MGKLNVSLLRYLEFEDFRILTAVEMGMKNHEVVPYELVASIAQVKTHSVFKILRNLVKHCLLSYETGKNFDGYRLTNAGYDYLALNALASRGSIQAFGNQIGTGKESNVYTVSNEEEETLCLKLHRLGRTCFRKVKEKRDYHRSRRQMNWLYLSRISAYREYKYLTALHERNFPVPKPLDINRHCIVMELIDGSNLHHITELENPEILYQELMDLIIRFADHGIIHGDFNEFNIMVNEEGRPIIIDFPQIIPTTHPEATEYFDRDVQCIIDFFQKRFGYEADDYPVLSKIEAKNKIDIDDEKLSDDESEKEDNEDKEKESNESEEEVENLGALLKEKASMKNRKVDFSEETIEQRVKRMARNQIAREKKKAMKANRSKKLSHAKRKDRNYNARASLSTYNDFF